MGLYDIVKVDCPLPEVGKVDWAFQTKDMENMLSEYLITENGELWQTVIDWYEGAMPEPIQVMAWGEPYHGYLNFYHIVDGMWYDFVAKFVDGKVVSIKLHKEAMP